MREWYLSRAMKAELDAVPLPIPNPLTPGDAQLLPRGEWHWLGRGGPITRPAPRELRPSPTRSSPALRPPRFGALCSLPLLAAVLKPGSQQPPPAHPTYRKVAPSCGGASSPPSNAPSNRVTSAPSGPMRAENSCAPASRSEPGARGASEPGGTDLQEPGLPAELQLPPPPPPLSAPLRRVTAPHTREGAPSPAPLRSRCMRPSPGQRTQLASLSNKSINIYINNVESSLL
ncbi:mucin-1-like [Canis lupus dingo]|uniref:mucin-1-like n=1 Tax=Canis lupus dingo TaxID=286419 RepID=UPI0020C3244F|nr:mucin-1-like [Canis lupus dingo]